VVHVVHTRFDVAVPLAEIYEPAEHEFHGEQKFELFPWVYLPEPQLTQVRSVDVVPFTDTNVPATQSVLSKQAVALTVVE
jgi:hypothetical protein